MNPDLESLLGRVEEDMSSCTESGGSRPLAVKSDVLSGAGGFDTSGNVELTPELAKRSAYWAEAGVAVWSDLDPFSQGYIEALFASLVETTHTTGWAFRYLAPETLAAILKDCKRAKEIANAILPFYRKTKVGGRAFWADRQAGKWGGGLPSLTTYLGDDGKVRLRPAESDANSPSEASAGSPATDAPIPSSPSPTDVPSGKGEP